MVAKYLHHCNLTKYPILLLMKITEFLRKSLSEANGVPSSKRLSTAFTMICFVPAVTYSLVYTTINNPQFAEIMVIAVLSCICGVLGISAYGKKFEAPKADAPIDQQSS